MYEKYRQQKLLESGYPGMFLPTSYPTWTQFLCYYDHPPTVCKCMCPIYKVGHDEKIFHANSTKSWFWSYRGKKKLIKKGNGSGLMVSGFQDSFRGLGLPLTSDELGRIN
jgi:hypothetical protein